MSKKAKEIIKMLKSHGFEEVGMKGSHLKMKNKKTGKTVIVPVHKGDMPTGTEKSIYKQAGIE